LEAPIPPGCEFLVSELLKKEPGVVWHTLIAVLKRMTDFNKEKFKDIVLGFLKTVPKEMESWREQEKLFDRILKEPFGALLGSPNGEENTE
jgi:hypothetical protein